MPGPFVPPAIPRRQPVMSDGAAPSGVPGVTIACGAAFSVPCDCWIGTAIPARVASMPRVRAVPTPVASASGAVDPVGFEAAGTPAPVPTGWGAVFRPGDRVGCDMPPEVVGAARAPLTGGAPGTAHAPAPVDAWATSLVGPAGFGRAASGNHEDGNIDGVDDGAIETRAVAGTVATQATAQKAAVVTRRTAPLGQYGKWGMSILDVGAGVALAFVASVPNSPRSPRRRIGRIAPRRDP